MHIRLYPFVRLVHLFRLRHVKRGREREIVPVSWLGATSVSRLSLSLSLSLWREHRGNIKLAATAFRARHARVPIVSDWYRIAASLIFFNCSPKTRCCLSIYILYTRTCIPISCALTYNDDYNIFALYTYIGEMMQTPYLKKLSA